MLTKTCHKRIINDVNIEFNSMQTLNRYALFAAALMLSAPSTAFSQESFPEITFSGYADARLSYSISDEQSWLNNGLGKTRYGANENGENIARINLAEIALINEIKFNWNFSSFLNIKHDPEQSNSVDIVEAYLKYNTRLDNGTRIDARLGTFYPHISLENYGIAWTSPYSITPSAINSWIGEEVKTTGLEITFEKEFENHALSFNGGIFGVNDTSGALLFYRGWALHDSKASVFSDFPLPNVQALSPTGMFNLQAWNTVPHTELDDRPGYFLGLNWELYGYATISGLYYNNRGNPETLIAGQYGWETDFLNIGITIDYFDEIEIFGQYMKGNTKMGPLMQGSRSADADYESFYILTSHEFGKNRLSARFDYFRIVDLTFVEMNNNNETGHSWMVAYARELKEGQRLILEALHVDSTRADRAEFLLPANTKETVLQASYRITF